MSPFSASEAVVHTSMESVLSAKPELDRFGREQQSLMCPRPKRHGAGVDDLLCATVKALFIGQGLTRP
jgi:hypothetical protein